MGARLGGIGLGTVAALGLSFFVFGLGRAPGQFPGEVLLIVLCVVTLAAALQAAGGLDLMVSIAEKALRRHPRQITLLAPLISYLFTFVSGTGHVSYSLLPIIAEVSRKVKERPERPLSISVIASQAAVTASPMSAATAGMVALLSREGRFGLTDILLVCIPSTLIGVLAGALRGQEDGRGTRGRSGLSPAARPRGTSERGEYGDARRFSGREMVRAVVPRGRGPDYDRSDSRPAFGRILWWMESPRSSAWSFRSRWSRWRPRH